MHSQMQDRETQKRFKDIKCMILGCQCQERL